MRDEKEQYYWDLIASKVSGNISAEEEYVLSQWVNSAEANKKVFDEAVELWKSTQRPKEVLIEVTIDTIDKEWEAFQKRVEVSKSSEKGALRYLAIPSVRLAIAASLSAVILCLFVVWQKTEDSWVSYQTAHEVLTITLPDSSHVWLNQNSELKVKEDFSDRQVQLRGEGYFQIRRDEHSPFTVETAQGLVTVLGTSFNVKSTDTSSVVSVLSGRVRVENGEDHKQELVALDQAVMHVKGIQKEKFRADSFKDWRLVNNPQYAEERNNKLKLLSVEYKWKKNAVNSTVLEGVVVSKASLIEYAEILLEIHYKRPNGKVVKTNLLLDEGIKPGDSLIFTNRLFDIFSKTEDITVKVASASVNN